jgi:hypothetical protein
MMRGPPRPIVTSGSMARSIRKRYGTIASEPSGLMTFRSYRPCGAPVKSKVAMIFVESITCHTSGSYSAMPGRTSLTIAPSWNCAPRMVVVTCRLSPPVSVCTSVISSGSSSASSVISVPAGAALKLRTSR